MQTRNEQRYAAISALRATGMTAAETARTMGTTVDVVYHVWGRHVNPDREVVNTRYGRVTVSEFFKLLGEDRRCD